MVYPCVCVCVCVRARACKWARQRNFCVHSTLNHNSQQKHNYSASSAFSQIDKWLEDASSLGERCFTPKVKYCGWCVPRRDTEAPGWVSAPSLCLSLKFVYQSLHVNTIASHVTWSFFVISSTELSVCLSTCRQVNVPSLQILSMSAHIPAILVLSTGRTNSTNPLIHSKPALWPLLGQKTNHFRSVRDVEAGGRKPARTRSSIVVKSLWRWQSWNKSCCLIFHSFSR